MLPVGRQHLLPRGKWALAARRGVRGQDDAAEDQQEEENKKEEEEEEEEEEAEGTKRKTVKTAHVFVPSSAG